VAEPKTFVAYITKWCLSQGIEEVLAVQHPVNDAWCIVAHGRLRAFTFQAGEWHRTKSEAIKAANKILARAIASQRDRLEELESVCFTEEDNDGTGDRIGEGERRPTFGGGDNPEVDARHRSPSQNERKHAAEPVSEVHEEGRF
jgi:hypothetical protein